MADEETYYMHLRKVYNLHLTKISARYMHEGLDGVY